MFFLPLLPPQSSQKGLSHWGGDFVTFTPTLKPLYPNTKGCLVLG